MCVCVCVCVCARFISLTFYQRVGTALDKVVAALEGVAEIVGVRRSVIASPQAEHVHFVPRPCTLSHHYGL